MASKLTAGVHHVGLTVPDLEQARAFFCGVLCFEVVGGKPDYPAIFVSDDQALLTLWRAGDPSTARPFDRRANIGLHHCLHFAFERGPGLVREGRRICRVAALCGWRAAGRP